MKKSELVQTLLVLRAEQMKDLRRFADSDLVNRGSRRVQVAALLRHLMRNLVSGEEEEELLQANVWKALFGKKPFEKPELSKITSDALAVVKEFIVREERDSSEEIDRLLLLARFYFKKDLDKFFLQTTSEISRRLTSARLSNRWLHLEAFRSEELQIERNLKYANKKDEVNLSSSFLHLDLFFLLSKLRLCCVLAAYNIVTPTDLADNQNWLSPDENLLRIHGFLPAVEIWLTTLKMFQTSQEAYFQRLAEMLDAHKDELPFLDLCELAAYLRLFCNRKFLTTGESSALEQLFGLQTKHLERGYLQVENGKVQQSTLLNLTSVGIRLKRFAEVGKALETVGENSIGPDTPERALALNRALATFSQGNIAEADKIIPSYYFEDVQHQIVCRVLQMKIWYETDETDRLESEINSFRTYILRACDERKVITPARKEVNLAFLRFLSSLLKYKYTKPQKQVLEKLEELREKKTVADRDWLLEKLEGLVKK